MVDIFSKKKKKFESLFFQILFPTEQAPNTIRVQFVI